MPNPTITSCFLCELARPEQGMKYNLLGFYGVVPFVRVAIGDFALPIQLCFVFSGGPGAGHFRVNLRVTAPNGQAFQVPEFEGTLPAGRTGATNIFVGFSDTVPGPGQYRANLSLNGAPAFEGAFWLDNVTAPQGSTAAT
jgi:hypothetical protein